MKKRSGGQTTRYLGGDYEIEDDGTVTKYLAGGKKRGTAFFMQHKDHLGSIQVVTNSAGWQVLRQKHKPFGDRHQVVGLHTESKGWIGEREEETELVYLNARSHDPEIGRFTAPDPIVRAGQGIDRYAYGLNSPVNFVDPSGLIPCHPGEGCLIDDKRDTVYFLGVELPLGIQGQLDRGSEGAPASQHRDARQSAREKRCVDNPSLGGCGGSGPATTVEVPITTTITTIPVTCSDCGPNRPSGPGEADGNDRNGPQPAVGGFDVPVVPGVGSVRV